jgi:hypothetical protein
MFNSGHDFWFSLAVMFMLGGLLADLIVTRIGIWNHGLVEANPVYKPSCFKPRSGLWWMPWRAC